MVSNLDQDNVLNPTPLRNLSDADPLELANAIVSLLDEKKASEIKLLHVADQTIVADYFILCTGTSNTQVRGLCGELEKKLGDAGRPPIRTEGYEGGNWIVMDYGSVLVHIFQRETREFYNLERLCADAKHLDLSALRGEERHE